MQLQQRSGPEICKPDTKNDADDEGLSNQKMGIQIKAVGIRGEGLTACGLH